MMKRPHTFINLLIHIAFPMLWSSSTALRHTGDQHERHSIKDPSRERLRIYCFTYVCPQGLSSEDASPPDLEEIARLKKIQPFVELEWGRIPHLHSQFSECDGHGIYSNETNETYKVQGLDPAIGGIPISGPQLRSIGSAGTYLSIWGTIMRTPDLMHGFDWYVMLDSDSFVQPDRVRDILTDFDNGMWQVGGQQEWAINAAMLKEMSNQWSWLNDRYKTGHNAGCPKWLLDDSGDHYNVFERKPWVHCAQDEMQIHMPEAINKHLPGETRVQTAGHPKWLTDIRGMQMCSKSVGVDIDTWLNTQTQSDKESCALISYDNDCKNRSMAIKQFCDMAIIHGVKLGSTIEGLHLAKSSQ